MWLIPILMFEAIPIKDYDYNLPDLKIARFPLDKRDQSKLLVLQGNKITDSNFSILPHLIPSESLLIFNNTRVIKARLIFHKPGGARIEVFCLDEESSGAGFSIWQCYVGNSKKWKSGSLTLLDSNNNSLEAFRVSTSGDTHLIKFTWNHESRSFEKMLEAFGKIPLPPYIDREPVAEDKARYQTIYAKYDGSVAAPTAGLHFTDTVFHGLNENNITIDYVTLHVGAGTFKPVSVNNALEHQMHEERVIIHRDTILRLIQSLDKTIVSVGTTSMRSLESLYWVGHQIITGIQRNLTETGSFYIDQFEPYQSTGHISAHDSLTAIHDYLRTHRIEEITGLTRIMIVPGYKFRICNALVTNFHQPQSTLLLLVAAFIGEQWKTVYEHALNNGYRFLSYGDSCLFFRHP